MITPWQADALRSLVFHWGSAYQIKVEGDPDRPQWSAVPVADPDVILTAPTAAELRDKIRDDHFARRPRHLHDDSGVCACWCGELHHCPPDEGEATP